MDKEAPEITPTTNLDGQTENAVKTPDVARVQAASEAMKEKKQDYYVDPLEQEALMQKKQEELNARKVATGVPVEEPKPEVDTSEPVIQPDMNVTGFFSTGETAKKGSIIKRPVSGGTTKFFFAVSIVSMGFSVIYMITLISTLYRANWFMGWIYGIFFFLSIVSIFFAVRSLSSMNESIKKYAILDLVFTGISVIPLVMLLLNAIFKLA